MRSEGAHRVTLCLKERAFRKILEQARAAFFYFLLFCDRMRTSDWRDADSVRLRCEKNKRCRSVRGKLECCASFARHYIALHFIALRCVIGRRLRREDGRRPAARGSKRRRVTHQDWLFVTTRVTPARGPLCEVRRDDVSHQDWLFVTTRVTAARGPLCEVRREDVSHQNWLSFCQSRVTAARGPPL